MLGFIVVKYNVWKSLKRLNEKTSLTRKGGKMKRKISLVFISLTLALMILSSSVFATDVLKVKQKIGKGMVLYHMHNEEYWGTKLLYSQGDKPWLLFGLTPLYSFNIDKLKVKIKAYIDLKLDVGKKHWPLSELESDIFIIPSIDKWLLYLRIRPNINMDNRNRLFWWGRSYLGYQISKNDNLRLQTEWSYKNQTWIQSIGPSMEYKITDQLSLIIYIGAETDYPHAKTGWIELKKKFK